MACYINFMETTCAHGLHPHWLGSGATSTPFEMCTSHLYPAGSGGFSGSWFFGWGWGGAVPYVGVYMWNGNYHYFNAHGSSDPAPGLADGVLYYSIWQGRTIMGITKGGSWWFFDPVGMNRPAGDHHIWLGGA